MKNAWAEMSVPPLCRSGDDGTLLDDFGVAKGKPMGRTFGKRALSGGNSPRGNGNS
ncbi:hypothetical protein ACXIZN_38805 [Amycolatopsis sp. TRM77291]